MKRVLTAVLILVMVPLFMGLFCPCASAEEPVNGLSITAPECHGCCPEIKSAPLEVADQIQKTFSPSFILKVFNVLKALESGFDRNIAVNRRAHALAGGEPFAFSETPLYLAIQVFRI